jgi:hypothetical protein
MLSVLKHTSTPVKFWFLKNYLSPTLKVSLWVTVCSTNAVKCDRMSMAYGKNFIMVTEIISIVIFVMLCVWDNVAWSNDLSSN